MSGEVWGGEDRAPHILKVHVKAQNEAQCPPSSSAASAQTGTLQRFPISIIGSEPLTQQSGVFSAQNVSLGLPWWRIG